MRIRIQDPYNVHMDPDPDPLFFILIRLDPKGVKNDIKTPLKLENTMYYKRILTFMFPVLYSPNETVHFLGFFTSWICADPDSKHCIFP